jgi:predicted O-methyltransferase YrrM
MNRPQDPSEWDFCPSLKEMIETDRAEGTTGKVFQPLSALSTLGNLRMLRALMLELKPEKTLEVGMAFGGSALVMATSHRDLGHSPSQQHIAIDPFQTTFWDSIALAGLQDAGLSSFVEHIEQPSAVCLPELLKANRESIEFVYIDGSHLFEDVFIDFYYSTWLTSPEGIILLDDSTHPDVRKVIRFIKGNLQHLLEPFDLTPWRTTVDEPFWKTVGRRLRGRYQLTAFRKRKSLESYEMRPWNSVLNNF